MNERVNQMHKIQSEALSLFKKKNADYGDSFAKYGPVGVLVRIGDKMGRFTSISNSGVSMVDNEGLRDTLIDLHNYAAMSIMLIDESNNIKIQQETQKVKDLIDADHEIKTVISNGYSLESMKNAGINAIDLRTHGYSVYQLKDQGFTTSELKFAGFTTPELIQVGCSANELRKCGLSNENLFNSGLTVNEIYDLNIENDKDTIAHKEKSVVNEIFRKKLSDLRRFCDDDMCLKEGGNRTGIVQDTEEAKKYAEIGRMLFRKEYQIDEQPQNKKLKHEE